MVVEEIRDEFERAMAFLSLRLLRSIARSRRLLRRIEVDPWRDFGGEG